MKKKIIIDMRDCLVNVDNVDRDGNVLYFWLGGQVSFCLLMDLEKLVYRYTINDGTKIYTIEKKGRK